MSLWQRGFIGEMEHALRPLTTHAGLGLVLRRVNFADADVIVTWLVRDLGVVSTVARGARRSRRRFGAGLDTCARSQLQLSRRPGAELWTLDSAELVDGLGDLAADLGATAHAAYAAELVLGLLPVEAPEPRAFDQFVDLLAALRERGPSAQQLRRFELEFLDTLGLAPRFADCSLCGGDDHNPGDIFDVLRGGVICRACAISQPGPGQPVDTETRRYLARLQRGDESVQADTRTSVRARALMVATVTSHLGRPLRSLQYLTKLNEGLRSGEFKNPEGGMGV